MLRNQTIFLFLVLVSVQVQAVALRSRPLPEYGPHHELRGDPADTSLVRLWLQLGQRYADIPSHWPIDMDSAYAYAQKAEALSRLLHFTKGYDQSQLLAAQADLYSKRPYATGALLRNGRLRTTSAALLIVGRQYFEKADKLPAAVDSAQKYVQQALNLSVPSKDRRGQAEGLIILGMIYRIKGLNKEVFTCFRRAALLVEKIPSPLAKAGLWYQLGNGYNRSADEIASKVASYQHALALYQQGGNSELAALALKEIADVHETQGLFTQALQELLQVVKMQKSVHSRKLHYTYDLIGTVYRAIGNYEQALPHTMAAIESARATGDTTELTFFYTRVGRIYAELGQRQQAMQYYQLALARAQQKITKEYASRNEYIVRISATCLAQLLLELNQPAKALALLRRTFGEPPLKSPKPQFLVLVGYGKVYAKLKRYTDAEKYYLSALQIVHQPGLPQDIDKHAQAIEVYARLGKLYAERSQYAKANLYLSLALHLAQERVFISRLKDLELQASQLDSLQGNMQSSLAHYQRYKALSDSIFNERKSNQLLAFQVQYDIQQKEHALKLQEKNIALLTQRSRAQQASLGLQQTERNALLVSAALLLALLALGYNRYQLKQRNNQQLLGQQLALHTRQEEIDRQNADLLVLVTEKEWLLKEIHHRVKNNLQIIMSLLNSQATSLTDRAALRAIQESQHRVQAMALIHQKIYQSERVARVPMPAYLQELVTYLREAYEVAQVQFELAVEPIELDIALAVPLGLIINEALTNSLKYAFTDGRAGRVRLALRHLPNAAYELEIADDGVGLPPGYVPERSASLGMKLLYGFGRQLGGELHLSSPPGLTLRLVFQEDSQFLPAITSNYA